ncbi:MAG: hypothetical protein Q9191_003170 [Dirinaria sp. TL-2023a]
MTNNTSLLNPLEWEGNYWNQTPIWPREPDISIIKTLAKHHLSPKLQGAIDDAMLDVSFFSEGAFNKLYLVSCSGHETSYLFRVTLPVMPFYKTESEVATLAYLQAKTSIPVAHVIAWDSNALNSLGFEWILMGKLSGVELGTVWRKIPWERKLELVDDVAGYIVQLQTQKFDSIGGLYFKSALTDAPFNNGLRRPPKNDSIVSERKATPPPPENEDEGVFVIGPIFSWSFYSGSRLYLPGHRGPYRSSSEWMKAEIDMQLAWVKAGPVEGDPDYDEDFEDEAPDMITECYRYLDVLPDVFFEDEDPLLSVLYHHDLNSANILVDPETFNIIGIVDWEMINIMPTWKAIEYPQFLRTVDPPGDEEPPIPDYEEAEDLVIDTRDQWDNRILRNRFDETMARLSGGLSPSNIAESVEVRKGFESKITPLCENLCWAQTWMKNYQSWTKNYKGDMAEAELEYPIEKDEDGPNSIDEREKEVSSDDSTPSSISAFKDSESISSLKVEDGRTTTSEGRYDQTRRSLINQALASRRPRESISRSLPVKPRTTPMSVSSSLQVEPSTTPKSINSGLQSEVSTSPESEVMPTRIPLPEDQSSSETEHDNPSASLDP